MRRAAQGRVGRWWWNWHDDAVAEPTDPENSADDADGATTHDDGVFELGGRDDIDPQLGVLLSDSGDGLLEYECSEWSGESRGLLAAMLTSAGIRHAWQGTMVEVDPRDETAVEEIIDEVMVAATRALEPDRPKTVYEVGGWPAMLQQSLSESLAVVEIPYEWDENGDLMIYEDDEDAVEAILDAMPDPEDEELADSELDVQRLLTNLWDASRDLVKSPDDTSAVLLAGESADSLARLPLPFGFEPPTWKRLVEAAGELRDGLTGTDDDAWSDAEVRESAEQLRDQIRPFI